jgi:hypothetical protein
MVCKHNYVTMCKVDYVIVDFNELAIITEYPVMLRHTLTFSIKVLDKKNMHDINKLTLKCKDKKT